MSSRFEDPFGAAMQRWREVKEMDFPMSLQWETVVRAFKRSRSLEEALFDPNVANFVHKMQLDEDGAGMLERTINNNPTLFDLREFHDILDHTSERSKVPLAYGIIRYMVKKIPSSQDHLSVRISPHEPQEHPREYRNLLIYLLVELRSVLKELHLSRYALDLGKRNDSVLTVIASMPLRHLSIRDFSTFYEPSMDPGFSGQTFHVTSASFGFPLSKKTVIFPFVFPRLQTLRLISTDIPGRLNTLTMKTILDSAPAITTLSIVLTGQVDVDASFETWELIVNTVTNLAITTPYHTRSSYLADLLLTLQEVLNNNRTFSLLRQLVIDTPNLEDDSALDTTRRLTFQTAFLRENVLLTFTAQEPLSAAMSA